MSNNYNTTNFITGIRAIAILMVFLVHSNGGGLGDISNIGKTLVFWGRYGVEIFFVVSGFTIFYQFYKEKYNAIQFITVRYLRISIPYYPILMITFFLMYFKFQEPIYWMNKFNGENIEIKNLIFHMLYIGGFNLKYINTLIGVEWTLYIEMMIYILFFILVKFNIIKFNIINTFIFLVSFFIFQNYINRYIKMEDLLFHWSILKYIYMFLLGGLAFFLREKMNYLNEYELNKISNLLICLIIGVFFLNLIYDFFEKYEIFFALLTFLSIVFIRDSSSYSILLNNRVFLFFGTISYSFYLWHAIVLGFDLFKLEILKEYVFLNFIYSFFLSVVISFFWYLFFEKYVYRKLKVFILNKLNRKGF